MPLIAGELPSADPLRMPMNWSLQPTAVIPGVAALNQPEKSNLNSVQPVHATSQAPDEVQIHIGRIEVTAVPPAPARVSPAAPQRRAPSLDDYLKSRDSRHS